MKERISVTLDKDIISVLNSLLKKRKFRNRSHIVEYAVERLAEQELASGMTAEDKKTKGESKHAQKD